MTCGRSPGWNEDGGYAAVPQAWQIGRAQTRELYANHPGCDPLRECSAGSWMTLLDGPGGSPAGAPSTTGLLVGARPKDVPAVLCCATRCSGRAMPPVRKMRTPSS